ncbi:MAG TPA: hypothetical protein VN426_01150 [Syntrophomonadaceae bacterium]|nr:hypothetical protein [Syntrophomonadaceae bacterium]
MVDERVIVETVISHITSAKSEIEKFPKSGLNKKAIAELDLAYSSLNDSISHCRGVFGPTTLKNL